jgi:hypothetical protein
LIITFLMILDGAGADLDTNGAGADLDTNGAGADLDTNGAGAGRGGGAFCGKSRMRRRHSFPAHSMQKSGLHRCLEVYGGRQSFFVGCGLGGGAVGRGVTGAGGAG